MKQKGTIDNHLKYLFEVAIEFKGTQLEKTSIKTLKLLTKKFQIRLSQDLKRNICFNCNTLLIPTFSSSAKITKKENGVFFKIRCNCEQSKEYCFKGQKGVKRIL